MGIKNKKLKIGDLIIHRFIIYDESNDTDTNVSELGIVLDLFENSGKQKFAEVLWQNGKITPIDLKSVKKIFTQ